MAARRHICLLWIGLALAYGQTVSQRAQEIVKAKGARDALPELQREAKAAHDAGDAAAEATWLNAAGICYKNLAEFKSALDYYHRSLAIKQRLGDGEQVGRTLNNIGQVYVEMSDYRRALANFEKALPLVSSDNKGAVENNIGNALMQQGRFGEAQPHLERAIELKDPNAVSNMGGLYQLRGRYREALPYYERAQDLGNLALCYLGLGDLSKSLELYDQAIAQALQKGDRVREADWHKGKGSALRHDGRYDAALDEYRQAVSLYERAGVKQKRVEALADLGLLHAAVGDPAEAEKQFRAALALARSINDSRNVTSNLTALGDLEWRRKRYPESLQFYQEALARARKDGDTGDAGSVLVAMALHDNDQKRYPEGARHAGEALAIARETGARGLEAEALFALGDTERLRGSPGEALKEFSAGEAIAREVGDPELGWRLGFGAAEALDALHRPEDAIRACRRAVTVIESVRGRLREERFQAGYIEDKYQVYVLLVRLLLDAHRLEEGFAFAERLHARRSAEMVRYGRPRVQNAREAELRERIRQWEQALERENRQPEVVRRKEAAEFYSRELNQAERDYENLLDDLRAADPQYAAVRSLAEPSIKDIQAQLPEGTALIEYLVAQDRVVAFVLTARAIHGQQVPVAPGTLNGRVELLRELIARPGGDEWRAPAGKLAELLVAPLERQQWLVGVRRLYIVPHQVLHNLPFAALSHGSGALGESYAIAYLPAASALCARSAPPDNDSRLLAMAPSRPGLKHAEEESRAIQELFPGRSNLLAGTRATESAFKKAAASYSILHLATHASFNKFNPMLSALALEPDEGEDGNLHVHEILDLRLNASLVALSACDTAMASGYFSELPAGDDLVGLTQAFLYAGSRSVLSTLWEVDDQSTALLMRAFYSRLGKMDKAAALAEAQRELARGPKYQHPYYWAPFILFGKMD